MENVQQVVVQLTTSTEKRALVQFGENDVFEKQNIITYNSLDKSEKDLFDSFVEMISKK